MATPASDVQNNLWVPGGSTGWHTHPGHSLIIVTAVTVTAYDGDDPSCTPKTYTVGMSSRSARLLLQFFEPVDDDIEANGAVTGIGLSHHQEPLAVRRDVVVSFPDSAQDIWAFKKRSRRAHNQIRLRLHVDRQYPGSAAEEDFPVG